MKTIEDAFRCMAHGNFIEAETIYQQLIELAPKNAIAFYELSWTYVLQHKYSQAEHCLFEVLKIAPKTLTVYTDLARVLLLQRKYQQAEQVLLQARTLAPQDVLIQYQLGRIYRIQGNYRKSTAVLQKLQNRVPDIARESQRQSFDSLIEVEPATESDLPSASLASNSTKPNLDKMILEEKTIADPACFDVENEKEEQKQAVLEEKTIADPACFGIEDDDEEDKIENEKTIADLTCLGREEDDIKKTALREKTVVKPRSSAMQQITSSRKSAPQKKEKIVQETPQGVSTVFPMTINPDKVYVQAPTDLSRLVFDDYLAKEKMLGQGGMGEVILVRHLEWDKHFAVKRCLQVEDQALLERFRQECLAWLSLEKHPNVVSAVHFTTWEGKPSLLIEYIEGGTLKEVQRELRVSAKIEAILNKLGTKPSLSNVMSLLTFFGGSSERKEIVEAWMTIIKEHSQLSIDEVQNILREAKAFPEHEIEYLQNCWPKLCELCDLPKIGIDHLLDYSIQICWGMAHAHRHGMLHRDLKPGNILLEDDSSGSKNLKVTDFGLAKMKGSSTNLHTQFLAKVEEKAQEDSGAVGTPRYMAPEQWSNVSSEKSDIYAFGMILYELFTRGNSPFKSHIEKKARMENYWWVNIPRQNESYYWSVRHCYEEVIAPSAYNKDLPAQMEKLILACLQKEEQQRPASFEQVAEQLLEIYRQSCQQPYPRAQNISPEFMALELNNRAISLLEMGLIEDGQHLLQNALAVSPNLTEAQLNYALFELRTGNLSLADFISKALDCFDFTEKNAYTDKSIMVLQLLVGIYLKYGCFYSKIATRLAALEAKFSENLSIKRLKGKISYLTGDFATAGETFQYLCTLENSRFEDWYHLIGIFFSQGQSSSIYKWLQQAPPHLKSHRFFNEIKKILKSPSQPLLVDEQSWYEIAELTSPYERQQEIAFIKSEQGYLLVFYCKAEHNVCEYYHLLTWEYNACIVPVANLVMEKQVAISNSYMAVLSTQMSICIHKLGTKEAKILQSGIAIPSGYYCHDGYLCAHPSLLMAVYCLKNGTGDRLSYAVVWHQSNWTVLVHTRIEGTIKYTGIAESGRRCWLADDNTLYTWDLAKASAPSGQSYGYNKQTTLGREQAQIKGVYILPHKRLLILQQVSRITNNNEIAQAIVQMYLWDLEHGKDHQKATLEDLVVVATQVPSLRSLFLLASDHGDHRQYFVSWNLEKFAQHQKQPLQGHFQKFTASEDGRFIMFQSDTESLLDILSMDTENNVIYNTAPWKESSRFQGMDSIVHLAGDDSNLLFIATKTAKIHVWKAVCHYPFPLLHQLHYLYTKPTSTFQDIGLQKKIHSLLNESEKSIAAQDWQRALDYIRSIQNFKEYDWKSVMDRIYAMAESCCWDRIGIRESLKVKKISWPETNFIVSPNDEYVMPNNFGENTPRALEVVSLQERPLGYMFGKPDHKSGEWFASKDGRFCILQHQQTLQIYDLQLGRQIATLSDIRCHFREAIADPYGTLLALKESGFHSIAILDLAQNDLQYNVSQTKHHSISDCCVMIPKTQKILLAAEMEGGFRWELLQRDGDAWNSKFFERSFTSDSIQQGATEDSSAGLDIIANRSYVIFRGINFDLLQDIHFRHIEIFELKHNVYFSLKEEKFCRIWLNAKTIATTPDGMYTFLTMSNGTIAVWWTGGHIKNWKQMVLLYEHEKSVTAMAITPDGKFLISGDSSGNIYVIRIGAPSEDKVWEEGDWEVLDTLRTDSAIHRLHISNNGRYLFACCENTLHIWEIDWVWDIEQYVLE